MKTESETTNFAYIRIHDYSENEGEKRETLKLYNIKKGRWYVDKGGTNDPLPRRELMLKSIGREGKKDELHIVRLFDLCRTREEIFSTARLLKRKNVRLFEDGNELNLDFFETLGRWEKDKKNHQTMKGRNRPGAGAPIGPRVGKDKLQDFYGAVDKGTSVSIAGKLVGVSSPTAYRWIKKRKLYKKKLNL